MPQKTEDTLLGERLESLMLEQRLNTLRQSPKQPSLLESVGQGLEQFGRGTVRQLPLIGMIGGGTAGTVLGAGPWGTVGGAAAGGGIGTGLKNIIESAAGWEEPKQILNQYYDIAKGTLEGATSEAGGAIVGKGLELGLRGAKTVTQGARDLLKEGFPITRGTGIEKIAEKIPPGSWLMKRWKGKLNEMVNNSNSQFITEKLGMPSPQSGLVNKAETQKLFNELSEHVGGKDQIIDMPNLTKFIDDKLTPEAVELIGKDPHAIMRMIQHDIEKNSPVKYYQLDKQTLTNLNYTDKQIDKLMNSPTTAHALVEAKIPSNNVSVRRDGKVVLFNEAEKARFVSVPIERTGEGRTTYDLVNKLNASLKGGKDINKINLVGEIRQAIRDDFGILQESTGKPVLDIFEKAMESSKQSYKVRESKFIQTLFEKSITKDMDKKVDIFNPVEFKKQVEKYRPTLNDMFKRNPEITEAIDAYANKMLSAARDLSVYSKSKSVTPTDFLAGGGSYLASKLGTTGQTLLVVPWGFETMMAHSLAHPRGWMKKFLFREGGGALPQLGGTLTKGVLMNQPSQQQTGLIP